MVTSRSRAPIINVTLGFMLIVGLLGGVVFNDFAHLEDMNEDMRHLGVEHQHKTRLAQELRNIIRDRMVVVSSMLLDDDPFTRDEMMLKFHSLGGRFVVTRAELESNTDDPDEKRLLKGLRDLTVWATPFQEQVVNLAHDDRLDDARRFLLASALPAQNRVLEQCDRLLDFYVSHANAFSQSRLNHYDRTHHWMFILSLLAVVASVLIALYEVIRIRNDRRALLDEIAQRGQAEEELRGYQTELEQRVEARTAQLNDSVQRLDDAQRIGHMGHWAWDIESDDIHWSAQIFRIFGHRPGAFAPTYESFLAAVHPDDRALVIGRVAQAMEGINAYSVDHRIVLPDGTTRQVYEQGEVTRNDTGEPIRMVGTVQDVTEAREATQQLRLAACVFEHTAEGILVTDPDGTILDINRGFSEITGYRREDVLGENPRILKSGRHEEAFYHGLWSSLLESGAWQGEIWDRKKSGEIIPVWMGIDAVKDDAGETTNYVAIFRDITEAKRGEEELWRIAHHDALCGLPNRNLMNAYLKQAMAQSKREGSEIAFLLLDLDNFKWVNDNLGHAAGDQLLLHLADALRSSVRESDIVARLAGDEFTAILSGIGERRDAEVVAEKILTTLAEPVTLEGREHRITASIGIAFHPGHAADPETLLKCADKAMYHAKREGKNNYQVYWDGIELEV